jgi:hypothetical protein
MIKCLIAMIVIGLFVSLSYSQQVKLAQTGFNFLNVSSDARAGAMGDAMNSISGYSGALSHNPATMADMPNLLNVNASVNSFIADIKYLSINAIVSPWSGNYGVLGISFQSVDYGDVLGTMVWNNSKGYLDTGVLNPSTLAIGIGYAKMISDRFSVGGQAKFAYQSLGESTIPVGNGTTTKRNVANTVAFDFGTNFKTGIKSLAFGMSIRNFSKEVTYEQEQFELPLLFTIGISANVLEFFEIPSSQQSFIISCDATHPRSHPEQLKIGAEYQFMKLIALRGGYITGEDEDGITFGLGVTSSGLGISPANFTVDYAYTPYGVFDHVQRLTVSFSI